MLWVCAYGRALCTGFAGAHAAGKVGHRLVIVIALVELFGSTCIVLLVVWQQLVLLLPSNGELLGLSVHACLPASLPVCCSSFQLVASTETHIRNAG
jgi:hypothetical protein